VCLKEHAPETTHDLKKKSFHFAVLPFPLSISSPLFFPEKKALELFFPLSLTESHAQPPPPQHDSEEDEAIGVVDQGVVQGVGVVIGGVLDFIVRELFFSTEELYFIFSLFDCDGRHP
jgi:hypothetical protein